MTELERVPLLAPTMYAAMQARGYQAQAARFAADAGNVLIADQPGLGKTIETLASLIESGVTGRVLIVAPRTSLRATWLPEIHKWLHDYQGDEYLPIVVDATTGTKIARQEEIEMFLFNTQYFKTWNNGNSLAFLIVNPEMLRAKRSAVGKVTYTYPQFSEIEWDAVVVDESHRYLLNANPRSKRCSQVGMGLCYLDTNKRIALSGTPTRGSLRKIWHTLRWLEPTWYRSEWKWAERYFETEPDPYSYDGKKITETLREDMRGEFERNLSQLMIRRTKAELRAMNPEWAPPEKMYQEVYLPMSPKQEKQYRQMEKETEVEFSTGEVMTAQGVLAILTRLKQFATSAGELAEGRFFPAMPSNKIDWLIDDFIPSRDNKIVVSSQYKSVINLLSEQLTKAGFNHFVLTGDTPDDKRQEQIRLFQEPSNDTFNIFLLTTTAGGVSVTLDAADDLVLLDETWVPDDQEQVEDRIHRTSRTDHQVNIYYVRSLGTIESEIAATVEQKDVTQKRVLDGSRGVDYLRKRFHMEVK